MVFTERSRYYKRLPSNLSVAETPLRLRSNIGIPQGGCLCLMAEQGENLLNGNPPKREVINT
jgi:hypothetical protein